jgi:hypothetical protein
MMRAIAFAVAALLFMAGAVSHAQPTTAPATQPAALTLEQAKQRIADLELEVASLRARLDRVEGRTGPAASAPSTLPTYSVDVMKADGADYRSAKELLAELPPDARPGINVGWSKFSAPLATTWLERHAPGKAFSAELTVRRVEVSKPSVPRPGEPSSTVTISTHDQAFEHVHMKMEQRVEPLVVRGDGERVRGLERLADGDRVRVSGVIDAAHLHPWGTPKVTLRLRDVRVEAVKRP